CPEHEHAHDHTRAICPSHSLPSEKDAITANTRARLLYPSKSFLQCKINAESSYHTSSDAPDAVYVKEWWFALVGLSCCSPRDFDSSFRTCKIPDARDIAQHCAADSRDTFFSAQLDLSQRFEASPKSDGRQSIGVQSNAGHRGL